jgi:hypothetical protein
VDGDHGGRASGLNGDAGPFQIEFVRNPRAQKIFVVSDESGNVLLGQLAVQSNVHEIGVQRSSGEHADASLIAIRITTSMLERLIGQLRQNTMLRIHGPGFHR